MTASHNRRAAPRGEPEIRAAALREKVLAALAGAACTTRQVVAIVDDEPLAVYRALTSLRKSGKVSSTPEHRISVYGMPSLLWSQCDAKPKEPIPPRDPLLWALFGSPP